MLYFNLLNKLTPIGSTTNQTTSIRSINPEIKAFYKITTPLSMLDSIILTFKILVDHYLHNIV